MGTTRTFLQATAAIVLLTLTSADANTRSSDYRLPKTVAPSHYSLDLVIDPEKTTYTGFVEITATAKNITDGVVKLHASPEHLTLGNVLFNYKLSCNITASDTVTQIVTLACPAPLDGEFKLTIDFEGVFSTQDMDGIYKSTYEEGGKQQVLISTQFESTAARRMFPCFDEPSYKATFELYVTHPTEYSVLANTPIVDTYDVGTGQIQTRFKQTPVMSTYLVALVVSKFSANLNANSTAKYDFQVYSRPEAKNFTSVATTNGATLIDILSNWTGIKYEDLGNSQEYLVAIPDFAAGAMENWGLITFREVDLLDEGEKTSLLAAQRILTVVAHELTHQWFGDYVTLDWWSNTWLNEGFATYFEYYAPNQLNSAFELDRQFVVDALQPVLQLDARPSTLPMSSAESDVNSPAEDSKKFDDISYDKAGSVIRMMRNILGETIFRSGLQSYLKKYNYTNTNPTLLLEALQTAVTSKDLDIVKTMDSWIFKAGFPLVTVQLNEDGKSVNLKQERFTSVNSTEVENTEWYIPISYTTAAEKDFTINIKNWLKPQSSINITVEDSWIIFNLQHSGFYRVNYDDELWDRIITALKNDTERGAIDVLSKAQLIDDAFNIARVGKVDYETAFELAEYLNKETEYYPWVAAMNSISYISGKLGDDEAQKLLQSTILRWITSAFPNGTTTGASIIDTIKDGYILDWACKVGQEECITYAKETFGIYKNTSSLPDYNKRTLVFCHALRNSENATVDFNFLFNQFKNSKSSIEQNAIISALGCIDDSDILSNYLSETINSTSSVRKQDAASVFKAVYSNSDIGVNVSLTFLENKFAEIRDRFKGMSALANLVTGLANKLTTDDQISRFEKILAANSGVEEIQLVAKQAQEIIDANKAFTDTYGSHIKKVLQKLPNDANSLRPKYFFTIILCLAGLYLIHF